jgi:DNA polymerase-3 subunit gamma/tau
VGARYKVYIIDEVHMLTEQAFNALLKTLEEPPAHVVFVFATTEVHKVPATILSRCQRFEFRRIPQAAVVQRLQFLAEQEHIAVEPAALALMARRAEGCLRDAESLLDQAGAASDGPVDEGTIRQLLGLSPLEELITLLDATGRGDLAAAAEQLDRMVSGGMEIDRIAMDMVDVILDLIRIRVGHGEQAPSALQDAAPDLTPADLLRCLSVLQGALQTARQSARPGPIIETAFFRLALMDRSVSIDEVLRTLESGEPESAAVSRVAFRSPATPERVEPQRVAEPPPSFSSADTATKPDDLDAAWRLLTASTKSFVIRATPFWRGDTLALQFAPADAFVATALGKADRREEIERALREVAGRPIHVEIVGTPSPGESAKRPVAASDDPLVKEIIRRFDGMVVENRPSREEVTRR